MKVLATILAGILMVASMAFAVDAKTETTTTVDTKENPITKTVTTKKVMKKMTPI